MFVTNGPVSVAYRARGVIARSRRLMLSWMLALLLCSLSPAHADVKYVYDNAGRVVQVIAADGASAQYQYDSAGNITAINRLAVSDLVITAFSPSTGSPGATVTIAGSAFSVTANQNTVRFSGMAATVTAATPNQLTVIVPSGATSGPISVTTAAGTVTSAEPFTVAGLLTISGFSPSHGVAGATVTVTGAGFNPVPGQTSVSLAQRYVTPLSISDTQIQFSVPAGVGPGPITVSTPNATATASNLFWVIPSGVSAADVTSFGTFGVTTATAVNLSVANKYAALAFDGQQNELLSLQATFTSSSGGNVSVNVYGPQNTLFFSTMISATGSSVHLPKLLVGGKYSVYFGAGAGTHQFSMVLDRNQLMPLNGTTNSATTAFAQSKRLLFSATAGQTVGIGVTGISVSPGTYVKFNMYQPNGQQLGSVLSCDPNVAHGQPGCTFVLRNLPATGTYQLVAIPNTASTMSLSVTASAAVGGPLALNTPTALNLDARGKVALYTFTATSGQTVAFNVSSIVTTPANEEVRISVYDASGTEIKWSLSPLAATINLPNLVAGNYSVLVYVRDAATATMQLTLASQFGGPMPLDGVTRSYAATVFNQHGEFTFNGTAGQTVGIGVTGISLSPSTYVDFHVYKPNENGQPWINNLACDPSMAHGQPGCTFVLRNLPTTGTYRLVAIPHNASTMGLSATASAAVGGPLALNTPTALNLDARGKVALYTFTATSGQTVAFNISSIVTTPANEEVRISVYDASGTEIKWSLSPSAATINLPNLVAGNYSVVVYVRDAATATMQVTLASQLGGPMPLDGVTRSYAATVFNQHGEFTFNGTAGQTVGIGVTGISLSPSTYVDFHVYKPNENGQPWVNNLACDPNVAQGQPGCTFVLRNLPATGTYRLVAIPHNASTMSLSVTASAAITGSLVVNSPVNVSLDAPGKVGVYTFSATAGQTLALNLSSTVTVPANEAVRVYVYNPSGTQIGTSNSATTATINLANLTAGTHTVLVYVTEAATATVQATLQ